MNFRNIIAELNNLGSQKYTCIYIYISIIYIHIFLYKILEQVKQLYSDRKQISGCLALEGGGIDCKGVWGNFLMMKMLCILGIPWWCSG